MTNEKKISDEGRKTPNKSGIQCDLLKPLAQLLPQSRMKQEGKDEEVAEDEEEWFY